MKIRAFFFVFVFACLNTQAESFVYLQNNTSYSIDVSTSSTLGGSHWNNTFSGAMDPWKLQTKLYETNRDQGITNGSNFYFTTTISMLGGSFTLKLKLNGNFIGSDMWQSSSGPGFSDPWYGDRSFHTNTFTIAGKTFELKYQADLPFGNTWDDIYYVIHEVDPYPQDPTDLTDDHIFNVLAYNVYMLTPPFALSDQYDRAKLIDDYVHGYDAIIISEAFYNDARNEQLLPRLATEYPYQTAVVDQALWPEDGGVLIVSRWPFDNEDQIVFDDCDGDDCLAAKGAMYVRIDKLGRKYHLVGTHTQAWPEAENRHTRQLQFTQMQNWLNGKSIPSNEAVLIGGDLNVDKLGNLGNEYNIMHQILHTKSPTYLGDNFTYNPTINTYGSGTAVEYLDYVLVDTNYFSPVIYTNQPQILRHVESVDDLWDNNDLELDLSDHFAVHGRFVFPKITTQPISQILCVGEDLVLSVETNVPLNYQWQKDGVDIVGATSSTYSQNDISGTDAGAYQCVFSYDCGQIISNSVNVDVETIVASISQNGSQLEATTGFNNYQWYLDGVAISGATSQYYNYTVNGTYTCEIAGTHCSIISNSIEISIVGVSSQLVESLQVFPNPTSEFLQIELLTSNSIIGIQLVDLSGRILNSFPASTRKIDVNELSGGLYLLRVQTNKGLATIRFQKRH